MNARAVKYVDYSVAHLRDPSHARWFSSEVVGEVHSTLWRRWKVSLQRRRHSTISFWAVQVTCRTWEVAVPIMTLQPPRLQVLQENRWFIYYSVRSSVTIRVGRLQKPEAESVTPLGGLSFVESCLLGGVGGTPPNSVKDGVVWLKMPSILSKSWNCANGVEQLAM